MDSSRILNTAIWLVEFKFWVDFFEDRTLMKAYTLAQKLFSTNKIMFISWIHIELLKFKRYITKGIFFALRRLLLCVPVFLTLDDCRLFFRVDIALFLIGVIAFLLIGVIALFLIGVGRFLRWKKRKSLETRKID